MTSEDGHSPNPLRYRNHRQRRFSMEDFSKRLSLPMDIRLPEEFLQKLQLESPPLPKTLSRTSRRASLNVVYAGWVSIYCPSLVALEKVVTSCFLELLQSMC
eukprot:g33647.t1